jgi:hypothetical protein
MVASGREQFEPAIDYLGLGVNHNRTLTYSLERALLDMIGISGQARCSFFAI